MSDQPPQGTIAGIIDRVLKFIDKPWKAATIVILFIVIGGGWIVYEKRDELFEAWLTPTSARAEAPAICPRR